MKSQSIHGTNQRSAMNRFLLLISAHIILIHSYSIQHWFISTGCTENEHNVNIKLIIFEICLIHTFIQIHRFRKILINDSNESNHSSKFIDLVVAAFTKKEESKRQRQQAKQTHKLLLSIVAFVSESYLFCDSCKCRFMQSRNQQHHEYC